ncbi:hypothetical protein NL329_29975, partial [Klebsiella pneumoniae]|nr:hypothetical protein [Klebsiella pneumoniae]
MIVASMVNPASFISIYTALKNLFTSSVFAATSSDNNMYGVKLYGPTEAQLSQPLYNNKSRAECAQEETDHQSAIAAGQDPSTSM